MLRIQDGDKETGLRSYLLGEASEEEQTKINRRLLIDPEYFDALLEAEESLTDEYARGQVKGVEKEEFDRYFLKSSEHQEGLELARLLNRYFSEHGNKRSASIIAFWAPRWRTTMEASLTCVALALMAASLWLLREVTNLRGQLTRLQGKYSSEEQHHEALVQEMTQERQEVSKLTQQVAGLQSPLPSSNSNTISISLTPGMDRSEAETHQVTIPASARRLRLQLKIQNGDYTSYQVQIETVEGQVVWRRENLESRSAQDGSGEVIRLVVPSAFLTRSDYLVMLSGKTPSGNLERAATYNLNIKRK